SYLWYCHPDTLELDRSSQEPSRDQALRGRDFRPAEGYSRRAVPLAIRGQDAPPASDQDGSTDDNPIALPAQRSTTRAPSSSSHQSPPPHPDTPRTTAMSFVYIAPLRTPSKYISIQ
ncbi:MAG: hypothetical protein ALECFALPRED_006638, partial [Alectoria fallacina]